MRLNRMCVGIAAASAVALVASPAVANAADNGTVPETDVHINTNGLTATAAGAVTFAPGAVGGDVDCFGPMVFASELTQEQIDQIGDAVVVSDGEDVPAEFQDFNVVWPDGLIDAFGQENYANLVQTLGENLADMTLAIGLSAVGEGADSMFGDFDPPDSMQFGEESNTFTFSLDGETKYTAIGQCATTVTDGEGESTIEDMQVYIRTINYDADSTVPGGNDTTGGTGSSGSLGSLGSLGSK